MSAPSPMRELRKADDQHHHRFVRRLTVWLLAWMTALIGTGLVIGDPLAIDLAPWFPLGLFFFTGASQAAGRWLVAAGWLLYVAVALLLLFARGRKTYRVALLVFCCLLVLNVVGCYKVTVG